MFARRTRWFAGLLAVAPLALPLRAEELTLEPGDQPGEVYFLWHASLNDVGARMHRLSEMASFERVFAKALIDRLEINEIRELDTDRRLPFNYVIPPRTGIDKPLRDVAWYYPHPIPVGGRARVQVRGKMIAPRIFSGDSTRIRIDYETRADCFIVIPMGFTVSYCGSPIVIHEKNAHTICAFSSPEISLIAKNVRTLPTAADTPVVPRDRRAEPIRSRLPLSVEACRDPQLLDAAARSLNGSQPVMLTGFEPGSYSNDQAALDELVPGQTLIWRIGHVVIRGLDHFQQVASQLPIGRTVAVHHVRSTEQGAIAPVGSLQVTVEAAEDPVE